MAEITIDPGICGLPSVVTATRGEAGSFSVRVQSECPMVEEFQDALPELQLRDIFQAMLENPVYRAASRVLRHASCPVPSGTLKALEVEAEMALPKDVHMLFPSRKGSGG